MGVALSSIGGILLLVSFIWLVVLAFQKSILWGICSLLIPFVVLIFGFMHLPSTQKPLVVLVVGILLEIAGAVMGGSLPVTAH
jgi:hypothetical protein